MAARVLRRLVPKWLAEELTYRKVRRRCTHELVRCIHGDEIIAMGNHRGECIVCGKLLKELPVMCEITNKPHYSFKDSI